MMINSKINVIDIFCFMFYKDLFSMILLKFDKNGGKYLVLLNVVCYFFKSFKF